MSSGKIAQVVGPVVDVAFAAGDKLLRLTMHWSFTLMKKSLDVSCSK